MCVFLLVVRPLKFFYVCLLYFIQVLKSVNGFSLLYFSEAYRKELRQFSIIVILVLKPTISLIALGHIFNHNKEDSINSIIGPAGVEGEPGTVILTKTI